MVSVYSERRWYQYTVRGDSDQYTVRGDGDQYTVRGDGISIQ